MRLFGVGLPGAAFSERKRREIVDKPNRFRLHPDVRAALFLAGTIAFFAVFAIPMGLGNAINTLMNTAYRILMETVFYIMAIAVIAGTPKAMPRR